MDSNNISKPTMTDKLLAVSVLWFVPQKITPNQITIFRFITIPFIAWLLLAEYYFFGGLLFMIAAFSDAMDGALARTRNQVTDWGKLYDPLADKFLISVTAIILIPVFISIHLAVAIIAIELFFIVGAYHTRKKYPDKCVQSNTLGKIKMFLQSAGLTTLIFYIVFSVPLFLLLATNILYTAVIFAIVNLVIYRSI